MGTLQSEHTVLMAGKKEEEEEEEEERKEGRRVCCCSCIVRKSCLAVSRPSCLLYAVRSVVQ